MNIFSWLFGKKKDGCGGHCECACESITIPELLSLTPEETETLKQIDERIVIGKVIALASHPDPKMTKVRVTKTLLGNKTEEQILCGGLNLEEGDVVAVATVGTKLSEDFEIGAREIRGVESRGMICSREELGITGIEAEKGGIWKLPAVLESELGIPLKDLL